MSRIHRFFCYSVLLAWFVSLTVSAAAQQDTSTSFTIQLATAENKVANIQMSVSTEDREKIEVAMPVWSPGFYRVENFADNIVEVTAKDSQGQSLPVEQTRPNRWSIATQGFERITIHYRLKCDHSLMGDNTLTEDLAVINGPATYFQVIGEGPRPQHVRLELPEDWKAYAGLDHPEGQINEFMAPNYDVLADSPILAGKDLAVTEFDVEGVRHVLVDAGDRTHWNSEEAAAKIKQVVQGMHDFWGQLPFRRYVFLNTLTDRGGGGLEHLYSTLISSRPNPDPNAPTYASFRWLAFVSHEYFHTFNVKRLRPIELGPFDYQRPPRTPSLWISEGLTSYYGDLIVCRSGLATPQDFLESMSSYIRQLQNTPGRLKQSLSQASMDVWTTSMSGMVRGTDDAVSYYIKGPVVGFLLDARIRRVTNGEKSLDDVMRTAYDRYSGPQGFTPQDFVAVAEEVAGVDLDDWFHHHLDSTKELDYSEALDWFGLQLSDGSDSKTGWTLSTRSNASEKQRAQLLDLTTSPSASTAPK